MPTAGKHDSFTEFQAKRVAEQHRYKDVLANQPKWVLRKKAYKPLASGVPDYSIGQAWLPALPDTSQRFLPPRVSSPVSASRSITQTGQDTTSWDVYRKTLSTEGMLEKYQGFETLRKMKNMVDAPERQFLKIGEVPRTPPKSSLPEVPKRVTFAPQSARSRPQAPPDFLTLQNRSFCMSKEPITTEGQSNLRKQDRVSGYYEALARKHVAQLLRDRQTGLECIRT